MNILKQVLTGPDNETVAWGRVMGAIVFAVFVVMFPAAALILCALKKVAMADIVTFMQALQTYLLMACTAAWTLVTATGFLEPKRQGSGI